jgi:hypothetical protein
MQAGDLIRYMHQWRGQPVVCIASGPSVTQSQVDYCRQRARTIAINDSYRLAPWADAFFASDARWWDKYHADLNTLTHGGQMWTMQEVAAQTHHINLAPAKYEKGLNTERGFINHGTHSGFQAINLAYQFGASKIILLGYDCKYKHHPECKRNDEGKCLQPKLCKRHWFGSHPAGWGDANHILRWVESYRTIKADIPIINCSPDTDVDAFPIMDLREALP